MEFRRQEHADEMGVGPAPHGASAGNGAAGSEPRYQECLRNHAAAQGGHVVDGCGEFMPVAPGNDGAHALRCAACGCHRSFHRKDNGQHYQKYQHHRFSLLPAPTPTTPRVPLLMPPPHPYAASYPHEPPPYLHHHQQQHTPSGGMTTESSSDERGPGPPSTSASAQGQGRKRFRTRFTAEQKEQMLALAERVGWRMQRQDEALVDHLCALAGVRRQVFKVWMHNNKHQHRRQPQLPQQHSHQQQQQ